MSEMEYAIALNDMVHMHSTQLRQRLFTQAAKAAIQRGNILIVLIQLCCLCVLFSVSILPSRKCHSSIYN